MMKSDTPPSLSTAASIRPLSSTACSTSNAATSFGLASFTEKSAFTVLIICALLLKVPVLRLPRSFLQTVTISGSCLLQTLAMDCQKMVQRHSKGGVALWPEIFACSWVNWVAVIWNENGSILQLLAVIQLSPTGSTRLMESESVASWGRFAGFTNMKQDDLGKSTGCWGSWLAMAWPHMLMKSEAENASPRTWAQLRPSDIPPHLKLVTCPQANNQNRKSVGASNQGQPSNWTTFKATVPSMNHDLVDFCCRDYRMFLWTVYSQ